MESTARKFFFWGRFGNHARASAASLKFARKLKVIGKKISPWYKKVTLVHFTESLHLQTINSTTTFNFNN